MNTSREEYEVESGTKARICAEPGSPLCATKGMQTREIKCPRCVKKLTTPKKGHQKGFRKSFGNL
jgi:hypothetical protein